MARKLIYRLDIEGHGDIQGRIEQDDTRPGSVRAGRALGDTLRHVLCQHGRLNGRSERLLLAHVARPGSQRTGLGLSTGQHASSADLGLNALDSKR